MIALLVEFMMLGLAGGLLGIFYRNCLKPKNMIFNWWYHILKSWVDKATYIYKPPIFKRFLGWVAFPLGYCIYCSTTWITIFLTLIYLSSWEVLPKWQDIVIGFVMALGVQHLVVASACRWLINNHPDLDTSYNNITESHKD